MKKILMLSTGGTIASVEGDNGLEPQIGAHALISLVPELEGLCAIETKEVLNIDSSNIEPENWSLLAKNVAAEYENYDGFVITHGTDTMAYTASALTYMLPSLQKPLVLTGSQLPAETEGTDAKKNILDAFRTAISNIQGVCVTFAGKIIKGVCATKMHTQNFNAFYSVNYPYIGEIIDNNVVINHETCAAKSEFICMTKIDKKVLQVKLLPGITGQIIDYASTSGYKGLIIEGYGAGGIPDANEGFVAAIQRAISQGVIVVCTSQAIYDGVDLNKYTPGHTAIRIGAVSAGKMTAEAAAVKLMWALGNAADSVGALELFNSDSVSYLEFIA